MTSPLAQNVPVRPRGARHAGRGARRPGARSVGGLLAAALVLALAVVVAPVPALLGDTPQAVAATAGFDPGNIISDEVFFDGGAMTTAEVKAFLKAKNPACTSTEATLPCLKSYSQNTPSMPKDAFCNAYKGKNGQNAAAIISKVAKACNVSAKVLLVLLQKEQSLVTSTAPTAYKYEHATGFACPDTAPCDPAFAGFFYQVYYGARQYQRYANDPVFSWRTLGVNELPYHPNKSCGTVRVNIQNKATLGLYFYTPYVPNAAALAAGYGEVATGPGAECASYGNRNFWALFNDWFGSTQIPVNGAIQTLWLAQGGTASSLGAPVARALCNPGGRYCVQSFSGGAIATTKKHGTFVVSGTASYTLWRSLGAQQGALGFPFSPEVCKTADKSCVQRFTGGYTVTTGAKARVVTGQAATVWRKAKTRNGALGLPKKNMRCSKKGKCFQKFDKGRITVHPKHGARVVSGAIAAFWNKKKAQKGKIGWPVGAAKCNTSGKRCTQQFTGGWLASRKGAKTYLVNKAFGAVWRKHAKKLGYPSSTRSCKKVKGVKVCTQKFLKGKIVKRGSRKPVAKA